MIKLHAHQQAAIQATKEHRARGNDAGAWSMPTGCVAGDTIIGVNRAGKGYSREIRKLAHPRKAGRKADPSIVTMVRSYLKDENRIGLNEAIGFVDSGLRMTYQLRLADGKTLRATDDHLIMTENGWVPLCELTGHDKVLCQAPPLKIGKHRKLIYKQVQGLKHHPFVANVRSNRKRGNNVEGRLFRIPYHRLVVEAAMNAMSVESFITVLRSDPETAGKLRFLDPSVLTVHHIDEDVTNNKLSNLAVLPHEEHGRGHGKANTHNFGLMEVEAQRVASITPYEVERTYDVQCAAPNHNFVANGMVVHNSGKTVTFVELAKQWNADTLVLVHRDELVKQTVKTTNWVWPEASVGIVQGTKNEWDGGLHETPKLVVASIQSLHERRLQHIPRDRFELVIADELHHYCGKNTWSAPLEHFDLRQFLLGVSATPERADGEDLSEWFGQTPIYTYSLRKAIEDGMLSRLTQFQIQTNASLDAVKRRMGDFAENQLAKVVNTPGRNKAIVQAYQRHALERKAVAFCVNVQHVEDLHGCFKQAGVDADFVHGGLDIDERRKRLARFSDGDTRVMCNCQILTEGYDNPSIDCGIMARPTQSRPLYVQMIGRILRLHPGKTDALVLDITDNCSRHKLIDVMSLMGATKKQSADGADVLDTVDEEHQAAIAAHEVPSDEVISWRLAAVCPWPSMPTLKGYEGRANWHGDMATQGQMSYLRSFGVNVERELTKGEASYLIDRCRELRAAHPEEATSKQRWFLKKCGAWQEGLTKPEASKLIGEIKSREREGVFV